MQRRSGSVSSAFIDESDKMKQSPVPMQSARIFCALTLSVLTLRAQPALAPNQTAEPPPPPSIAQATAARTRAIALQEAIELALQHNLDLQIQRFGPDIARHSLDRAIGGYYDPVAFASGQHNYGQSPGRIDPQLGLLRGAETDTDSFAAGLSGRLPLGFNYSLRATASDTTGRAFDALTRIPLPFETASANAGIIEMRQPLLRNFWVDPARSTIQVARNRLKYSEQVLRQQIILTINAVEQAYYNLIFARESVRVQETALQLAERLLWENRKRVEVGQLAPLDEKQAESQVAARHSDLIAAQRLLALQENALKRLITDQYSDWHAVQLIAAENLVAIPETFDLQESWSNGLTLRPDLLQARLDVQRGDINLRLDRNQLFPQLDLIGQYGYAGTGQEVSGALGQIRDRTNPYWFYGASISWPLGNRAARANYKASQAEREQLELFLKRREQDIMVEIDDAIKQAQSSFERVEATRQARLFAEAALEAEQKKLESGKSTSFFVLQFQRDLTAARFEEIRALAEYNIALSQLALRQGITLQKHGLDLIVK
jgi:outer membrane protein TolC